ncbi:MAG: TetR/AcrR family transcriptional regulator [Minwuia sp.]|uniref:TetR/AcrR family transcriptional regulator n=1 Tax=Minwuia sp. TaxID=2493630 RepID=UPI003A83B51D
MPDALPPRRTQIERRAESDRRMLAAAVRLIGRHGSVGTSLAEIGTEAGYSRGLPAARFGTKLALLEAVVDASEKWFERKVARRLGDTKGLAALFERMAAHLEGARDDTSGTVTVYQLYVELIGAVSDLRPRMQAFGEAYRQGFRRHLVEARERGELRDDVDVDRMATTILGAVRGVIVQSLVDGGVTDLNVARDHLTSVFREALTPKAAV